MNNKPLIEAIDELLNLLAEAEISSEQVFNNKVDELEDKYHVYPSLSNRLLEERLVNLSNKSAFVTLTEKGRKIQEQGGYKAMLEETKRQSERDELLKNLDIKDKKGSIADRRINRWLAIAAIFISVLTFIYTVYQDFNKTKNTMPVQKESPVNKANP